MSDIMIAKMQAKNVEITEEKILEYMEVSGVGKELTNVEKRQFIEVAKAYQLNPFKREIYCVPHGTGENRTLSIITGYEVYLKRAERIGKLNGWRAWTEIRQKSSGKPELVGIVEIHRTDWDKPFIHEVYFDEVKQLKRDGSLTHFWAKQPRFMLKKIAISQGFRMCFPDEFAGMPYTEDELTETIQGNGKVEVFDSENIEINITEDPDGGLRGDLMNLLQGAIIGGLIEKCEMDVVVENSKKYSGKVLETYIKKIKSHLDSLSKSEETRSEEARNGETRNGKNGKGKQNSTMKIKDQGGKEQEEQEEEKKDDESQQEMDIW